MALNTEQQLVLAHRMIRNRLDEARVSELTTEASRRLGKVVAQYGVTKEDAKTFIKPVIERILFDLADAWGLLDRLDEDFSSEQIDMRLAELPKTPR